IDTARSLAVRAGAIKIGYTPGAEGVWLSGLRERMWHSSMPLTTDETSAFIGPGHKRRGRVWGGGKSSPRKMPGPQQLAKNAGLASMHKNSRNRINRPTGIG